MVSRDIQTRYMTVSMDVVPEGFSFQCWMSTAEFWNFDRSMFPYAYTYMGDRCTWLIRSNRELTNKVLAMAGETAEKLCDSTIEVNRKRKIANL